MARVWSAGHGEPAGYSKRGVGSQASQLVLGSAMPRAVASSDWLEQKGTDHVTFWEVSASCTSGLILSQHSCVARAQAVSLHLCPLPFHSSRPDTRHSNGQSKNGNGLILVSLGRKNPFPGVPWCLPPGRARLGHTNVPAWACDEPSEWWKVTPPCPRLLPVSPVGKFKDTS